MAKKIFLLLLFLTVSCGGIKEKSKPQSDLFTELRKGKNWEEIINSNSDIPFTIDIFYSKTANSLYGKIFEMGEVARYFLRYDLKEKRFYLYGEPGQCPTCLNTFISSVTLLGDKVAVGQFYSGYNFYDLYGTFLFKIKEHGCPAGRCFQVGDKLFSLPQSSSDITDFVVYVFDLPSKKFTGKFIEKRNFLSEIGYIKKEDVKKKNNKVVSVKSIIAAFKYALIDNSKIAILASSMPWKKGGIREIYYFSIKDYVLHELSLKKYCSYLSKNSSRPYIEPFGDIIESDNKGNLLVVRKLAVYDNKEVEEKYGFLFLIEIDLNGNLKNIYSFPRDMFPPGCIGAHVFDICKLGQGEFILNAFFGGKVNSKDYAIKSIIKAKAKKLTDREVKWLLERL